MTKRRWMRFSLRAVIVSVALLSIVLALAANRAAHQRRVVRVINRRFAFVEYRYRRRENFVSLIGRDFLNDVTDVHIGEVNDADSWIPLLVQLPGLIRVYVATATEEEVSNLKRALPGVEIEGGVNLDNIE